MKINLNVIDDWLATTPVVACWTRKVLCELAFTIHNGQSPIR